MTKKIFTLFIILLTTSCSNPKINPIPDTDTQTESNKQLAETLNFEELLEVSSVDEARIKARKALRENKMDLAQAYYIKAYDLGPNNISLLQEMAQLYKNINRNDLVEHCYQLILQQDPDHYQTHEQYGLLLIKQKKLSEAQDELMRVLVGNNGKKNWRILNGLGLINDLQGQHKQAIQYFKQALEINPRQLDILNNVGYSLYRDKQYKEAIGYYNKALAIDPKYDKALFNYALLKARIKDYHIAVNVFSRLMSSAEANNNVGYIAMKNGDLQQAENFFQQAITFSSRYYKKAHENLEILNSLKHSIQ